jgi:trans-aconitate 2-methyltransferase
VKYTFGDSPIASERLRIVAEVMEPPMRALLDRVDAGGIRRIVDLGCGPGHTTALLAAWFAGADVVGIDRSAAFLAETSVNARRCRFARGDIRALPVAPSSIDLVYARYLLSHRADVEACINHWSALLARGGYLVLEEPESIRSTDPDFEEYEAVSSALVRSADGVFYAGPEIAAVQPPGVTRVYDEATALDISAGQAAAMFWRNAMAWDPALVAGMGCALDDVYALADRLRARQNERTRGVFEWQQRQTILRRR